MNDFFDKSRAKRKKSNNASRLPVNIETSIASKSDILPGRVLDSKLPVRALAAPLLASSISDESPVNSGSVQEPVPKRTREVSLTPPPQLEKDELRKLGQNSLESRLKQQPKANAVPSNALNSTPESTNIAPKYRGEEIEIRVRLWPCDLWYKVHVEDFAPDEQLLPERRFKLRTAQQFHRVMDAYTDLLGISEKFVSELVFEYSNVRLSRSITPGGLGITSDADIDAFHLHEYGKIQGWRFDLETLRREYIEKLNVQDVETIIKIANWKQNTLANHLPPGQAQQIPQEDDCIKLKIRCADGNELLFTIGKHMKLERLKNAFVEHSKSSKSNSSTVNLLFDSDVLDYQKTPQDYEMEDMDLIDAVWN